MEDAKRIAVAGYRQVLEDGKDVCNSESDAEYSDHGEDWKPSEMYTPEMIAPDSIPNLASARPTTRQANALRPAARAQARESLMAIPTTRSPTPVPSEANCSFLPNSGTDRQLWVLEGSGRSLIKTTSRGGGRNVMWPCDALDESHEFI
jgi:hypothetical protein